MENRFDNHPLWPELDQTRTLVNQIELDPDSSGQQDALEFIGITLELLEKRREESDPLEVTPASLDNSYNAVVQWNQYLREVVNGNYKTTDVVVYVDTVIQSLTPWPPLKPKRYLQGISAAVESFAHKTEEMLSTISEQKDTLKSEIVELRDEEG